MSALSQPSLSMTRTTHHRLTADGLAMMRMLILFIVAPLLVGVGYGGASSSCGSSLMELKIVSAAERGREPEFESRNNAKADMAFCRAFPFRGAERFTPGLACFEVSQHSGRVRVASSGVDFRDTHVIPRRATLRLGIDLSFPPSVKARSTVRVVMMSPDATAVSRPFLLR
jgi:hypothetical protein